MGRNPEPIDFILEKGKSHKTKKEIDQRKSQEVPVIDDNISPPEFLTTKKQKQKFQDIADVLHTIGIISNVDCDALGRYILSEESWVRYGKLIAKMQTKADKALREDDMKSFLSFTDLIAKYEGLRVKAFNQAHACATALGLTITSRCRLVMPPTEDNTKGNKFSKYIANGG